MIWKGMGSGNGRGGRKKKSWNGRRESVEGIQTGGREEDEGERRRKERRNERKRDLIITERRKVEEEREQEMATSVVRSQ